MKRKPKARKAPGARNPLVAHALFRKAGSHRKTDKSMRRQANIALHGVVAQLVEQEAFTLQVRVRLSAAPPEITPKFKYLGMLSGFQTVRIFSGD